MAEGANVEAAWRGGSMRQYLDQNMEDGPCCFVIAVANCLIHLGLPVPDLEECKDVAGCQYGPTIFGTSVVEFMNAPLVRESDADEVLKKGGILCIMHPIFNGHAAFVFPECYPDRITMINSWLGPTVTNGLAAREIRPFFITDKIVSTMIDEGLLGLEHIGSSNWVLD